MLNMSRHMFLYSVLLLLCVLLLCCGGTAVHAEEGITPKQAQLPEAVDLFVPYQTIVETQGQGRTRDSFALPSLTSAGGVLVALAEGNIFFQHAHLKQTWITDADVVAGYIDSAESWSSFVAKVRANKWGAYSVFNTTMLEEHVPLVGHVFKPTTIAKGDKVFLLMGGHQSKYDSSSKKWIPSLPSLDLFVGEATQDKVIQWGEPTSIFAICCNFCFFIWPGPACWRWWLRRCDGGWHACVSCDGEEGRRKRHCLYDHLFEGRRPKSWVLATGDRLPDGVHSTPSSSSGRRGQLLSGST
ncbi:hypothetical protein TRSC58_04114 [Trypanosoma rangeli SC58]|uniref:Trans-sialidase n=1 Tax=Trypanosoma rangeli SC58 TaxID=429131 RepID=A0A061J4G5_TRYRA|nr:hypothetical protein TRSC58_04114 [Trypanosoma rangeli SC58]